MTKKRYLMIGAGGMAGSWVDWWTKRFGDRVEIAALVDINEQVLEKKADEIELPKERRFTDYAEAIRNVEADFAGVATPPWVHEGPVLTALEAGMAVLCEKPISDSMASAVRMHEAAQKSGRPVGIIQNYRYQPKMQAMRQIIGSGDLGRLQYIVGRYACDYRKFGAWGEFRHKLKDALLIEGVVHHLDMFRFLAGADCQSVCGYGWNPPWSSFDDLSSGMYILFMSNGSHCFYEGNSSAAGKLNGWYREYYRAELKTGVLEVDNDGVLWKRVDRSEPEKVELPQMQYIAHEYLFDKFLNWINGGPRMATYLGDNLQTFATLMAAIDAGRDGGTRKVADYLCGY